MRKSVIAFIGLLATPALAQFGPPEGGGSISLVPPANTSQTPSLGPVTPTFQANHTFTVNAMIGYVNDQPIFANDVFRPIDAQLRKIADDPKQDFSRVAKPIILTQLSNLITDIVVVSSVEGTLSEEDRRRIDVFLSLERNRILTENGGSEPLANAALAKIGSSVERELADRRRSFIRALYFQRHIAPRIQITRDMALAAYERDPKRWQQEGKLELYTITLPVSRWLHEPGSNGEVGQLIANPTPAQVANAEAQAASTAREIIANLRKGVDFATLAEDYKSGDRARDKGGRWGSINSDSLANAQLRDFVVKLPANTLGDPLLIREKDPRDSTVVVAKVGTKVDARTEPFEEAQATITKELKDQMTMDLQDQEMRKLEKKSTLEAVERMGDVAVDAAVTRYATK